MATIHPMLADISASISELKKDPMGVVNQGSGRPVAILNRNVPVFYAVPAAAYEAMLDALDDIELVKMVKERQVGKAVEISIDEL